MAKDPRDYAIEMYEGTPEGGFELKIDYFREKLPGLSALIRQNQQALIIKSLEPLLAEYRLTSNDVCLLSLGINPSEIDLRSDLDAALIVMKPGTNAGSNSQHIGQSAYFEIEDQLKKALMKESIIYNNILRNYKYFKGDNTLEDYCKEFAEEIPKSCLIPEGCAFLFSERLYGNEKIEQDLKSVISKNSYNLIKGTINELMTKFVLDQHPYNINNANKSIIDRINIKKDYGGLLDIKLFNALLDLSPEYREKCRSGDPNNTLQKESMQFMENNKVLFRAVRNCLHLRYGYEIDNIYNFPDFLDDITDTGYYWLGKDLKSDAENIKEYLMISLKETKEIIFNCIKQKPLSAASSEYGLRAFRL
jgi:hypothetical protein